MLNISVFLTSPHDLASNYNHVASSNNTLLKVVPMWIISFSFSLIILQNFMNYIREFVLFFFCISRISSIRLLWLEVLYLGLIELIYLSSLYLLFSFRSSSWFLVLYTQIMLVLSWTPREKWKVITLFLLETIAS